MLMLSFLYSFSVDRLVFLLTCEVLPCNENHVYYDYVCGLRLQSLSTIDFARRFLLSAFPPQRFALLMADGLRFHGGMGGVLRWWSLHSTGAWRISRDGYLHLSHFICGPFDVLHQEDVLLFLR